MKSNNKVVKVTKQTKTGRNVEFDDNGKKMTRPEFVKEIKSGNYPDYYVKDGNGVPTPCSKPDDKKGNNLG